VSDEQRTRRPPPPFRQLTVLATVELTHHMRRVVIGGPELAGLAIDEPAASVRLLIPPQNGPFVIPTWTGNQFELDGQRAPIRTMTPRRFDAARLELTLDVVLHERGAATDWARRAQPGDPVAISGPARGYPIDADARSYLLAGDETALPAIGQLLEALPERPVTVIVELSTPDAEQPLPDHPGAITSWCHATPGTDPGQAFAAAVETIDQLPEAIWIAGEAAAVQRLRKHLFERRAIERQRVSAHGYWKFGRSAT